MKKIIAFILTVSILVQTIVSTNIFALQDFNDNSEDEISQSETYTDGSGFREYSVTYENITDHEIMLYLGISENGYDTAMQVLSSLQEKGYTREEQIELLGIVVQGFFSIEEAESIYGYIPEKDSRDKALKQFERFASLFNISEEINDSRLIEEAFTTHNTFDTDRQIVSSEYYLEFLPETYTVSVTESINELDDTKTDTVLCFSDTAKQRHLELTSFSSYLKAKELFLNGMSIDSIKSLFCLAASQNKHIEEVIPSGSNSLSINPETTYTAMSATLSNSTDYEDAINAGELIMTLTEEEEANDSIYSPFKIDIGSNENINIQYGTVSYEQDIFSLPGRNGMDISLKIKYDSSQADLGVDYKGYVDFDTSNDPFGIGTGWYIEVPHFYRKGEVVYIPGRGKFNFAQIVPDKSNRMPGGKPKGYLGGDVIIESWYFDPGNNIEIPLEQPDILDGKADNALHTADGKSYYFDGFRALCETDRFGNMILYEYDEIEFLGKEVLTSIVDTNGNRISFEYSDLGENQYLLTITAPDESEFKIYFSRHAADKTETYTRVDKICNQENEITEFYYQFYQLKCNFFPYLPEVESDTNYCNLLKTVTYPTGLKSEYTYKMLYDYAATDRSLTNEKYVLQSSAFTETDGENVTEYGGLDFEYYGFEQTDPDYDDKEYGDYAKVTENNGVTHEYDFVGVYRSTEKKYDSDGNLAETIETRFEGPNIERYSIKRGLNTTVLKYSTYTGLNLPLTEYSPKYDSVDSQNKSLYETKYSYDVTDWEWNDTKPLKILKSKQIRLNETDKLIYENQLDSLKRVIKTEAKLNDGTVLSKTEYSYDEYGNVVQIKEYPDVSTPEVFYETQITYVGGTKPSSVKMTGVKDADGNLVDGTGIITENYVYDSMWRLTQATDGLGNTTVYDYDDTGRLIGVTYSNGEEEAYLYDAELNKTVFTDRMGNAYTYQYTKYGMLDSVKDPDGTVILSNSYDNRGRLTSSENAPGSSSYSRKEYTYDDLDRVITETVYNEDDEQVNFRFYEYAADTDSYTVYLNTSENYTYEYGEVKEYDKYGQLIKEYKTNTYEYPAGELLYNLVLDEKTYEYDHLDRLTKETGGGINNVYTYTNLGSISSITDIMNNQITYEYDDLNRMISQTDARGYETLYEYDALGRLIKQQTPLDETENGSILYSTVKQYYDNKGSVTKVSVSSGEPGGESEFSEILYSYDSLGRLVSAQTGDIESTYTYNAYDDITSLTVGASVTVYTYDELGRMSAVTDALGQSEYYSYDDNGFLSAKTDRNGTVFSYTYDALGRTVAQTAAAPAASAPSVKTWTYDERGNLVSLSEDDKSIEYSYDKWHRLTESRDGTEISVDNGEPQEVYQTYSYTDDSYLPERHRLVQGEAAVISTLYEYRDDNRLQKVIEDGVTAAEYEYDANGNNTKITYGNGIVTERTFTPGNQIKTLVIRNGSEILYSETNSYRLDGNLSSRTYTMNGETTVDTYDYDEAGMLSGESRTQAGSEQYDYTFAYDNRGNRTSFAESVSGEVTTYEYDLNNRLVNAEKTFTSPNQYKETTSYYYDPNGNTVTSVMETSDEYNRLGTEYYIAEITTDFTDVLGGYEFTRYEYDAFGRLTYFKNGSHEAEYTYNPDDMRSGKTVDGRTNVYVWDGDEIAAEFDYSNDTVILQKYIYGLDRVLMEGPGSVNVYYQQNSHGDTVTLTGTVNGNVYGTYEYDAFGNATDGGADYMVLESGHMVWSATKNNQFRYCGEYFDQETDSYYLRARYYDPAIGRFITEDPARDGIHWYAYTLNTPILNCDPSGMWIETILDVAGIAWSFADFIANPSLVNAAFLVWDVASIVLPLVPGSYVAKGGKYIIKSGSKADDVVDSLKALNAADRAKSIKDGAVVMAYKDLKKITAGTDLQAHHLIEKRFADTLGISENDILSIAIDPETHKKITALFRKKLPYSTKRNPQDHSAESIWEATQAVYTELGMEEYLEPLKEMLREKSNFKP